MSALDSFALLFDCDSLLGGRPRGLLVGTTLDWPLTGCLAVVVSGNSKRGAAVVRAGRVL